MKLLSRLIYILISFFFVACSQVELLNVEKIYSPQFLAEVTQIKKDLSLNKFSLVRTKLSKLYKQTKNKDEAGKVNNLFGVLSFRENKNQEAIKYFTSALSQISADRPLLEVTKLNLASVLYKTKSVDDAYSLLKNIDPNFLTTSDKLKSNKLSVVIGHSLEDHTMVVESVLNLASMFKSFSEFESSQYEQVLTFHFQALSDSQKNFLLESHQEYGNIVNAYLGVKQAELSYLQADREKTKRLADWLKRYYTSDFIEVREYVESLESKISYSSEQDPYSIGVLLPISGEKSVFSKKALQALFTYIKINDQNPFIQKLKFHIEDHANNKALSSIKVQKLVQEKKISILIGGLFPETAYEEYLAAKRSGVLFISLSALSVGSKIKNPMLIEVPGSLESQLNTLKNPSVKSTLGEKMAIFYPNTSEGKVYRDYSLNLAKSGDLDITAIESFEEGRNDYRDDAKKVLGLTYPSDRIEEYNIWEQIYALKDTGFVRRVQTLPPVIDFQYVFIPTSTSEAVKLLPAFQYLDAQNLKFVGPPMWLSKKMINQGLPVGEIYFTGSNPNLIDEDLNRALIQNEKSRAGIVERLVYDALLLTGQLISQAPVNDRAIFESKVSSMSELATTHDRWVLKERLWIKEMSLIKLSRRGVQVVAP